VKEIRQALRQHLLTVVDAGSVQWENQAFTPTTGAIWYRETLMPAEPSRAGIGAGSAGRYIGLYQVDVFTPAAGGAYPADDEADALIAAFGWGTTLTYGGTTVRVEKTYKEPGRQEPDWYHVPVIVEWRADL